MGVIVRLVQANLNSTMGNPDAPLIVCHQELQGASWDGVETAQMIHDFMNSFGTYWVAG
jgi:hypothetical protein